MFDAQGSPVASNARLHGKIPALPGGVLDYTRQHGQNRISYQPEVGVRSAVVIEAVNSGQGGYVLAGRSLREVEKREDQALLLAGLAWAAAILAALALAVFLEILSGRRRST